MDDDSDDAYWEKLIPVWRRILTGVVILLVVVGAVSGWWLWQISHNQVVVVRTPMVVPQHSSARSPFEELTARALSAPPARASATPSVATATPTPTPTPIHGLLKRPLQSGLAY
ncbi:MAG: hypothetical protein WA821_03235 [Anaerolineales bacterium]